jgi:D-alanyl-lipoteichoic acid acyltransferase DltB (MBOAT superfamily)
MLKSAPKISDNASAPSIAGDLEESAFSEKRVAAGAAQSLQAVTSAAGAGEESLRQHWARIGVVVAHLVLALVIIYRFQIESRTFFEVMLLATGGFVVNALMPLRYRLAFFVSLSIASIILALGVLDGLSVIGLGLLLIGICHLPIGLRWRAALLILSGAVFALWRLELVSAPWTVTIWPVLASMFMFRVALYLYALQHDEKRPTPSRTLAYFFMLPNVCFPLFPVVDYSTFRRTYYDRDEWATYQTGLKWIARGLVHLIAYRFVYVHLTSDPAELRSLGELVQFLLATFLLYLRVSGQFHLITGILHLFGFRLPETHHLYFLSSSFADFWRRINIYWKDFMMKLVYYPSFFKMRRFGGNVALVMATVVVFFATWILHSYQWFWLRGGFPIEAQDGLFWGSLGALVVVGSLREMKRSRARKLTSSSAWSASLALRTVGTFTAICVLWSLWSAESVVGWILMWDAAATVHTRDVLILVLLLVFGLLVGGKPWPVTDAQDANDASKTKRALPGITLVALVVLGFTNLYSGFAPDAANVVATLQRSTLNSRDAALQHKGYYENLDNVSRQSAQLWNVRARKPADWIPLGATSAWRDRDDFLGGELVPDAHITFLGQPLTTNQWGMRDKERAREKPDRTYRIALLGPSHAMGSGVSDQATFAHMLEERLNASPENTGTHYEVLNFGVAGYSLTEQLALLQDRVFSFQPDAIFTVDSPRLLEPVVQHLAGTIARRLDIPFRPLADAVAETGATALGKDGIPVPYETTRTLLEHVGVHTRMPWREAERRLRQSGDALIAATFAQITQLAREHRAVPVFIALDNVGEPPAAPVPALKSAEGAGLLVFDLFDLWRGRQEQALRIAEWDNHPNADGNRLIADRLAELIEQHRVRLGLPPAVHGNAR